MFHSILAAALNVSAILTHILHGVAGGLNNFAR